MAVRTSVKMGSLNMPKMIRHLSHRTGQVKSLTFIRPALYPKSSKVTGQSLSTKGSVNSTARIEFIETASGQVDYGETITIISTDQTSRAYIPSATGSESDLHFNASGVQGANTDHAGAATSLETAIESAGGHNGKITVSRSGAILTLTQAVAGIAGNTLITEDHTGIISKNFTGAGYLAGPPVNFGYEKNSSVTSVHSPTGDNSYYHTSPLFIIPEAFNMLQQPIASREGGLQRSGNRQTGRCKFVGPTWKSILNSKGPLASRPHPAVGEDHINTGTAQPSMYQFRTFFSELEVDDILMERDVSFDVWGGYPQSSNSQTSGWTENAHSTSNHDQCVFTFPTRESPLFHVDRFQCKFQSGQGPGGGAGQGALQSVVILVEDAYRDDATLTWTFPGDGLPPGFLNFSGPNTYTILDLPIRDVKDGDTITVYAHDNTGIVATATLTGDWNTDAQYGTNLSSSRGQLETVTFNFKQLTPNDEPKRIWDFYFYKGLEWTVDSIKEYSGEYLQIQCSMVRGVLKDSIKRAYG